MKFLNIYNLKFWFCWILKLIFFLQRSMISSRSQLTAFYLRRTFSAEKSSNFFTLSQNFDWPKMPKRLLLNRDLCLQTPDLPKPTAWILAWKVQPRNFVRGRLLITKKLNFSFSWNLDSARTAERSYHFDTPRYSNSYLSITISLKYSTKVSIINLQLVKDSEKNSHRFFCSVGILIVGNWQKAPIFLTNLDFQIHTTLTLLDWVLLQRSFY